MKKTLHRDDVTHEDLTLLARFIAALKNTRMSNGCPKKMTDTSSFVWILGTVMMTLPIWYKTGDGWKIAKFGTFEREAVGIERKAMKRICYYLKVEEPVILDLLMKLSMLGVWGEMSTPDKVYKRTTFKIADEPLEDRPYSNLRIGFVVELRRLQGNFR